MMFNDFDFSTIHVDRLKKYPVYKVPRTYHLQDGPGNYCAGDAPGYPTWFTRVVYTQYGNYGRGNHLIICAPDGTPHIVGKYADESTTHRLRQLWIPVSQDSLRFKLWELHTYRHFKHCYYDPEAERYGSHVLIVSPPQEYWNKFHNRLEINGRELTEYEHAVTHKKHLITPENHFAVHAIRKFYPDYQPNVPLFEAASSIYSIVHEGKQYNDEVNNRWWERFSDPSIVVDYTGMPVGKSHV